MSTSLPECEVELLREMCQIYSPSGCESEIASYLVDYMQRLGWQAYVDSAGNAVGSTWVGTTGEPPNKCLVFLGHIDTVPGFIPVRVSGGILYGRGSVDAKAPLAAFISALARMRAVAEEISRMRVVVIGAVGEETDSKGAYHAVRNHSPDMCIIGEPSGWSNITIGYKGCLNYEVTTRCAVGHSAGSSHSAAEKAVAMWNELAAYCDEKSGDNGPFGSLSPTLLSFWTESDGFCDSATMRIVVRLPLQCNRAALEADMRQIMKGCEISFGSYQPAFRASKNNVLVRAFLGAIREQHAEPKFKLKTGTSDMNIVGSVWNCPVVAYGPGDSSLDHTPNEHIALHEYARSIYVLSRVIQRCAQNHGTNEAAVQTCRDKNA